MKRFDISVEGLNPAQALALYASHLEQVTFNPEWISGSYMDHAVTAEIESVEQTVGFKDPYNRVGVIVKTHLGNIVIFQRYSNGQDGVVVSNCPQKANDLMCLLGYGSSVSKETLCRSLAWLGDTNRKWYFPETGCHLASIFNSLRG